MKRTELQREREEWRRQEYRRLILRAAERVIARKGYTAMTMEDVARDSQFSKPTLYHYFKSKGELMLELLGNFFEEIEQEVKRIKAVKTTAQERLRRGIQFYLEFNKRKENISRMLMMDRSFMEKMRIFVTEEKNLTSEADREFLNRVREKRQEILESVADILRDGVEHGEFRKMNISAAVIFFESILEGYCHVSFWLERRESVREATALLHSFFLQGIERKEARTKGESR
ncbi:MAG: TetR/AcrR family transcriptional regulator [Acidobacteriota bacterium]